MLHQYDPVIGRARNILIMKVNEILVAHSKEVSFQEILG